MSLKKIAPCAIAYISLQLVAMPVQSDIKNAPVTEKKYPLPDCKEILKTKKAISRNTTRSPQPREIIREKWRNNILDKQREARWLKFQQEIERITSSGILEPRKHQKSKK